MPLSVGQFQTPNNSSQALANGIATAEGYGVAGAVPTTSNNPGDLKLGDIGYGETAGVTNFATPDDGFAALNNQVQLIQSGQSKAGYTTDMSIQDVAELYTGGDSVNGAGSTANWATTVANTVNSTNGGQSTITPTSNFSQTAQGVVTPSGTNPAIPSNTTNPSVPSPGVNPLQDLDPADYVPVAGQDISDSDVGALTPSYVIQDASLDATPWYDDSELISTHPSLNAAYPSPITFQIELPSSAQSGNAVSYLSDSNGQPITIELNVSMKSLNTTSKHIIHKNPTRTGMHITFWGMQPDVIVGEGTTGAFFNQFGLANFMSTAAFTGSLQTQILQLLTQSNPIPQLSVVIENNGSVTDSSQLEQIAYEQSQAFGGNPIAASEAVTPANRQTLQLGLTSEALRVAAQDAFQELLYLFKENGVIYFHPSNYKGFTTGAEQSSPTAWSPATGTSSFEMNARNNDVMARGKVAMKFKSSVYLGYFKSFSWTQDAEHPFLWNFNFTFQVENTMTLVYYPQLTGSVATAPGNS